MTGYKRTLWRANTLFLMAIILGIVVPIPAAVLIDQLLHAGFTTSSHDTLLASPLILVYTSPIWFGICLLGYLTDLIIVPQRLSFKRYLIVEWLIGILVPLWPIIDNFSLSLLERSAIYIYFIPLAFLCFYLKARYLSKKGSMLNSVI
ncbi:hypothetical protein [Spirosoma horti]